MDRVGHIALRLMLLVLPGAVLLAVLVAVPPLVTPVRQGAGIGESAVPVPSAGSVVQSFVATATEIDAVSVVLAISGKVAGDVTVAVNQEMSGGEGVELGSATKDLRSVTNWQNVIFRIPGMVVSPGSPYEIAVTSPGGIMAGSTTGDVYPDGDVEVNGARYGEGDLIFRVHRHVTLKDLSGIANGAPVWLAAVFIFACALAVGWAMLRIVLFDSVASVAASPLALEDEGIR